MNVLVTNSILYLLWFIWAYKKEKNITVYSFLILFYLSLSVIGIFSVDNGIYFDTFGTFSMAKLSMTPYIFAFISYFVLLLPFYKIKCNIDNIDYIFCKKTTQLVWCWVIVYFLYTLLKLSEAIISVSMGLASAYDNRHNEGVTLFEYSGLLSKFNGYASFLLTASTPFIMLYVFFGLKNRRVTPKTAMFLMALCFLPSFLGNLGMGSRGGMFMTFFCFLFFIFILREHLTKRFIHNIFVLAISFVAVVLIYSWAITVDRVGESSGLDSIIRYFGESFPNLGWTVWDHAKTHPMGARFLPEYFEPQIAKYSVDEGYAYWRMVTDVPVLNFKTYYGDLYVEFGEIGAFIFLALTSIPVWLYYKKHGVTVLNFAYLYFYFQICVFAFSGFTKTGWHSIFELIIITLFTIGLKFLYKRNSSLS